MGSWSILKLKKSRFNEFHKFFISKRFVREESMAVAAAGVSPCVELIQHVFYRAFSEF